ncbi:hypothetical protein T265_07876 [Opisthorchis viverrini]|uniref:Uncharacterized protein n=1 Tax=Opisthorchis viverrini TaxID=6198 RepID=A0A074ZAW2_OPIVI|nr:hypothetical protein T265_07876 [Opisthorchis viverrini]KER24446.1 hypothetical protein T265_07876 [Opisthorchis viverrini]
MFVAEHAVDYCRLFSHIEARFSSMLPVQKYMAHTQRCERTLCILMHGERQPLTDKNKTDPGNLGKSLDPM